VGRAVVDARREVGWEIEGRVVADRQAHRLRGRDGGDDDDREREHRLDDDPGARARPAREQRGEERDAREDEGLLVDEDREERHALHGRGNDHERRARGGRERENDRAPAGEGGHAPEGSMPT